MLHIMCVVVALLVWMPGMPQVLAQADGADYLLMVDVSGNGRNIYIEDIQQAIDTFYISAIRHARLRTLNFAKTVVDVGSDVPADFYDYCDLGLMLRSLGQCIGRCEGKYVRAVVVSYFHHSDSVNGNTVMPADSLADVAKTFSTACADKDVQVTLMVIPPSTRYAGYSLEAVERLIGADRCEVFPVASAAEARDYLLNMVDDLNHLRGITDGPPAKGSASATITAVVAMVGGVAALCLSDRIRRRKNPA